MPEAVGKQHSGIWNQTISCVVKSEWDAEVESAEGWMNRVTSHSHPVLTVSLSGLGWVHTGARLASTITQQVLLHE